MDLLIVLNISPISVKEGEAPARVKSMILEWAAMHQQELLADWERCDNGEQPLPIEPLD